MLTLKVFHLDLLIYINFIILQINNKNPQKYIEILLL